MSDFEAQFEIIRRQYIGSLGSKIDDACALWDDTLLRQTHDRFELFKMKVHSFVGSAATFGCEDISQFAHQIEDLIDDAGDGSAITETTQLKISLLLEKMRSALAKILTNETHRMSAPDTATPASPPETALLQKNSTLYDLVKDRFVEQEEAATPAQKPLILVVDDDEQIRMAVGSFLATKGFRVQTAVDGRDALNKIMKKLPDLVVTDYLMPQGAGHYLISKLRNMPNTKSIPIIVLTGHRLKGGDDPHGLKRALVGEMHVNDFLMKPLNFETLYNSVKRCLQPSLDRLQKHG